MKDTISRQGAIDELVRWDKISDYNDGERNMIACCIAMLSALPSAQPECEDAVSRFEVLRLIDYSSNDLNDSVDNWYFQGKVKELPSVTPKQPGWVPTSERLPEGIGQVIIQTNGGAIHEVFFKGKNDYGHEVWMRLDGDIYWDDEVVAWQPLPTPYREGGQDGKN